MKSKAVVGDIKKSSWFGLSNQKMICFLVNVRRAEAGPDTISWYDRYFHRHAFAEIPAQGGTEGYEVGCRNFRYAR